MVPRRLPWGEYGFQMAQQGGFSAAGGPAQQHIFSRANGEIYIRQRLSGSAGIGKAQILDMEMRHAITSLI